MAVKKKAVKKRAPRKPKIEPIAEVTKPPKKVDARIGNKFWMARSSHGRKPKFSDPEVLWGACIEYFEWNVKNPLYETKLFSYQGEIVYGDVAKMRAMTIAGLCLFLDISVETWSTYRTVSKDFSEVTRAAEEVIRRQKFEGASADLLNANIIARDLGLVDKAENKTVITLSDMSDDELERHLKALQSKVESGE